MDRYGWSLENDDWDGLVLLLAGFGPGKSVLMAELHVDSVPTTPGVYAVCSRIPTDASPLPKALYNVLYVGETENLRKRFREHCRTPSDRMELARVCFGERLRFWYAPVADPTAEAKTIKQQIQQAEGALITAFGPPVNKKGPLRIRATIGDPRPA